MCASAPTTHSTRSSLGDKLLTFGSDIKLSHSVFALPFALLATFLAAGSVQLYPSIGMVVLVVMCMVLARTWAMGINRLADAKLDALNPRTAGRAIPSGRLPVGFVRGITLLCGIGFVITTAGFWQLHHNPWPMLLSPIALAWLALYSYTKRFTWLCHLWLGSSLALSPIAAAIAVEPGFMQSPDIYLLAVMVLTWVAGFDIIYALQDVAIDRSQGLYSMPAKLGEKTALRLAGLLHVVSLLMLIALLQINELLALGFGAGVGLVAGLLVLEHALIWSSPQLHLNLAFFTVNGAISLLLGSLGILDTLLHLRLV